MKLIDYIILGIILIIIIFVIIYIIKNRHNCSCCAHQDDCPFKKYKNKKQTK